MSAKAIREYDGKHLLAYWLPRLSHPDTVDKPTSAESQSNAASSPSFLAPARMVHLAFDTALVANQTAFAHHVQEVFDRAEKENPWVKEQKLVCKPDQLIKRRGKNGLLGIG